jgi:type I site-specific restriction-modification system R (restriction) subunit
MTPTQYEDIKRKVETLKEQKARHEGMLQSIIEQWKTQYNISTIEEAEALLFTMKEQEAENDRRKQDLMARLEGLTNWALV